MRGVGGILMVFLGAKAAMSLDQGALYARGQTLLPSEIPKPRGVSEDTVPGYKGTDVPESHLGAPDLAEAASRRLASGQEGSAADLLKETSDQRGQFDLTTRDPLIAQANALVQNPEKIVGALKTEDRRPGKPLVTRHRCQTSPFMTVKVEEALVVKPVILKEIVETGHHSSENIGSFFGKKVRGWVDSRRPGPHSFCKRKREHRHAKGEGWETWQLIFHDYYYNYRLRLGEKDPQTGEIQLGAWQDVPQETYEKGPATAAHEGWRPVTPAAEALVLKNACQVVSHTCLEGPQTKIVEGLAVEKPCWRRQTTYECAGPHKKGCQHLIDRGCAQISSTCLQRENGRCTVFENFYECVDQQGDLKHVSLSGDIPYCLDGNCAETGYAPNQDMAEVLSKLAIFREMQKDMSAVEAKVFSGSQDFCDKHIVGFSDCCQKQGGWGRRVKLTQCKAEELELSKKREKGQCTYVGTFCAEKLPVVGTCLRKRSHYCCFASKLARLVQEQGRQQLGLDFGTGEHPHCRALTVHELAQIDFSKIDLSELFTELTQKVSVPDPQKMATRFREDWQKRLPTQGEEGPSDLASAATMKSQVDYRKRQIRETGKGQYTMHHQDTHPHPKSEIHAPEETKLVF